MRAHSSVMPAHARAAPASLLPCNAPVLGCPGGQRAPRRLLCSSAAQAMGPGEENLQRSLQHCFFPPLLLPSARSSPYINIYMGHLTHSNRISHTVGVSRTPFQQLWGTAPSSLTSFPAAAQAAHDIIVHSLVFSSNQGTELPLGM